MIIMFPLIIYVINFRYRMTKLHKGLEGIEMVNFITNNLRI